MTAKRRFTEIDGLRGIAAFMVLITHFGEGLLKQPIPAGLRDSVQFLFMDNFSPGRVGVVAFFCISGFVIPFSFRGKYPLVSFPIGRFFRLYPAFWCAIALAAIVYSITGVANISPTNFLVNMTMLHRAVGVRYILTVDWTLLIEWVFYIICYVLFAAKLLNRFSVNFAAMAILLAVAVAGGVWRWFHPMSSMPIGIPTYLAAMHFGTLTRMRLLGNEDAKPALYNLALLVLVIGVFSANTLAYHHTKTELIGVVAANTGYFVGLALFLACVYFTLFTGPIFVFLGGISYSLYLLHVIVLAAIAPLWAFFPSWDIALAILMPVYVVISIGLATLAERFIEQPSIKIGRKIDAAVTAGIDSRGVQSARA